MRHPERETIGGRVYEVTPLPAGPGVRVMVQLARMFAPALGAATSLTALATAVRSGFADVADRLDPEQLEALCRTLATYTRVEVTPGKVVGLSEVFDLHFQANYFELLLWLKFALQVNFGPLVDEVLARAAARAAPGASAAAAPSP